MDCTDADCIAIPLCKRSCAFSSTARMQFTPEREYAASLAAAQCVTTADVLEARKRRKTELAERSMATRDVEIDATASADDGSGSSSEYTSSSSSASSVSSVMSMSDGSVISEFGEVLVDSVTDQDMHSDMIRTRDALKNLQEAVSADLALTTAPPYVRKYLSEILVAAVSFNAELRHRRNTW